jgi:cytochrome c oxidase assembly factor CtaG
VRAGVAPPRPRQVLGVAAVLVVATALLPPIGTEARRYEWVEGFQFILLATALPALTALSLPPRAHLAREGWVWLPAATGLCMAGVIAWRVPGSVDALAQHGWLAPIEAASLLVAGIGLWSLLTAGPPPAGGRPPYPWRMASATAVMWTIWVMAYLIGFSRASWYPAYGRAAGLSARADQEWTSGVLWVGAALTVMPVIFWSLVTWLRAENGGGSTYRFSSPADPAAG